MAEQKRDYYEVLGVDKTAAFWLGDAYKPFLEKLSKGEIIVNE